MKILNVNISLDPLSGGGTAERTFQMSRHLAGEGVECTVLTLNSGLTKERLNSLDTVTVKTLPCINKRFYLPRPSITLITTLIRLIKNNDLIHIMGHWTVINALVYILVSHIGKPYVICPAGSLMTFGRSRRIKKLYNWFIGNKIIRNANRCIAVTPEETSDFRSYGVASEMIVVIPNAIDAEDYADDDVNAFRTKFRLSDHPVILFLGRLNMIKGPDLLLQAFCNMKEISKEYHLVFAGPDEGLLASLRELAVKQGVSERVHFIGFLKGPEKSQAYRAADLLVIPSRKEAMSIVVLEAGIVGTPVLITDQCGMNELAAVRGGKVVPASVEGIQSGLFELLGGTKALKSMGENLKIYVKDRFLWSSVIKQYIELYEQLLKKKARC